MIKLSILNLSNDEIIIGQIISETSENITIRSIEDHEHDLVFAWQDEDDNPDDVTAVNLQPIYGDSLTKKLNELGEQLRQIPDMQMQLACALFNGGE